MQFPCVRRSVEVQCVARESVIAADAKALDFRAAARLALPGCGDTPPGLGFGRIVPDTLDQGEQVVDVWPIMGRSGAAQR